MAQQRGGGKQGPDGSRGRTLLFVVIAVLAVAAAIFSITRTVRSSQGENKGSLGGFASKAELMRQQQGEETPGQAAGGKSGPAEDMPGSGREGPAGGFSMGGKGSGN